jgi:hypothetical protein
LQAEPLREAVSWLVGYREFWEESFERLDELLVSLQAGSPAVETATATQEGSVP